MSSDPCRTELPRGVDLIRQKVSNKEKSKSYGSYKPDDEQRVKDLVNKWEDTGNLPKTKEEAWA